MLRRGCLNFIAQKNLDFLSHSDLDSVVTFERTYSHAYDLLESRMRQVLLVLVGAALTCLPNCQCFADVVFSTDISAWQSTNPGFKEFGFTSNNVLLADEITTAPGHNEAIGSILTFDETNTGLGFNFAIQALESGAEFTFDDNEGGSVFDDVLSVGDINNFENDDFRIDFSSSDVFAFGFELLDNDDVAGESFSVFGASGLLGTLTTIPGSSGAVFIGVTSDEAITHVVFDEDAGGDDIAVRSISASTTAVPEPNAGLLVGMALLFVSALRRKQSN